MSETLKLRTTAFGGFQRQDVVDYIEQSAREHAAQLNALRREALEELTALPGIGEKRARDIIAYRTQNGPFRIPEDLTRVSGIGEGILEGLIDYITVS